MSNLNSVAAFEGFRWFRSKPCAERAQGPSGVRRSYQTDLCVGLHAYQGLRNKLRCSRAVGAIYQRCPVIGLLSLTGQVREVGANPLWLYAQTPKGYEVEGVCNAALRLEYVQRPLGL